MQQQMPCASGNTHMQAKLLTELQILQTGTDCGFKTAVLLWMQILGQIHGQTFTGNFRIHIPLITISTLILQTTQNSKMHKITAVLPNLMLKVSLFQVCCEQMLEITFLSNNCVRFHFITLYRHKIY